MTIRSVYLAGPDVFRPDAHEHGMRKKRICERKGVKGLFPLDGDIEDGLSGPALAAAIYEHNMELLRKADAVIANLSPFRGANCDPGTAFELGAAVALGKKTAAYMCLPSGMSYDLAKRTIALCNGAKDDKDVWRDGLGMEIEDFGLPENLMLSVPTHLWFERIPDGQGALIDDLGVFETALDSLLQNHH
ncbi:MAG: nucleoside 2-deoxyribosyltransferase [Caulobacterales bacterium]